VNELVNRANKYIDETTPWALAKDETKSDELASVMNHLARAIYVASRLLHPVLVVASDKAFEQLGLSQDKAGYENIHDKHFLDKLTVNKGNPLFPRLDPAIEVPFINELMSGK
ncbi:MAG: methionine--tRNA ligase, partial [Bacilli bacterium]|nr:methionine--tRNA ligase [Bacilli bacterium]